MKQAKARAAALALVLLVAGLAGLAQTAKAQAKHYKLAGVVKSVEAKQHKLVVQHGEIPGFMGAMTMGYDVRKTEDLSKIAPGDSIAADLVVTDKEMQLENVKVTGRGKGKQ